MNRIVFIAAVIFFMNLTPRLFANQIIPGGQIEAMARTEIENLLASKGESRRYDISLIRPLADFSVPNGIIDIKLSIPAAMVNYNGVTPVKARIYVGGKMYRDVNFVMSVKVFDFVLVSNHLLRMEVPVTEADFRMEEVAIDGRTEYVKDIQEILGLVPHRVINAGIPVTINYFQQPVAVSSNQQVKIIVRYKGIEISAKGTALTRGRIGEVIHVRNDASKKVISARVVDFQTVEVVM